MKNLTLLTLILFITFNFNFQIFSHEGHDHDKPALVQAPKGGIIKGNEDVYLEVVTKHSEINIYLYDKNLKPLKDDNFSITAMAKKPRVKNSEMLTLNKNEHLYTATYDAKGAHRYTLTIEVSSKKGKYSDKINFTIEPKS